MTSARSELVDLETTPYYHCMTRCVRRAFLCGQDELTGQNFDHRKVWIIERIKLLSSLFAIDVCAYAVMSNHIHLILRALAHVVAEWNDEEILRRAGHLCPSTLVGLDTWSKTKRRQFIQMWRERLTDISWFMRLLDEYIARGANKEDGCTGRFWDGRFKSKALIDDGALLTSMAYVDLNPVRAGIATGLDDSSWTSIHQRLREVAASMEQEQLEPSQEMPTDLLSEPKGGPDLNQCPALAPMEDGVQERADRLPISLLQYIALLEWTGRTVRNDKRGFITSPPTALLTKFGLDPERWLESVEKFGNLGGFVGHPSRLKCKAAEIGRQWLKGQGRTATAYSLAA